MILPEDLATVVVDTNKSYFDADGNLHYFKTIDDLKDFISEKCGRDVADSIQFISDDKDINDVKEKFYDLEHFFREVWDDDLKNPILKLKTLKRLLNIADELKDALEQIIPF